MRGAIHDSNTYHACLSRCLSRWLRWVGPAIRRVRVCDNAFHAYLESEKKKTIPPRRRYRAQRTCEPSDNRETRASTRSRWHPRRHRPPRHSGFLTRDLSGSPPPPFTSQRPPRAGSCPGILFIQILYYSAWTRCLACFFLFFVTHTHTRTFNIFSVPLSRFSLYDRK